MTNTHSKLFNEEKGVFDGSPADYNEFKNGLRTAINIVGAVQVADHLRYNSGIGAAYVAPAPGAAYAADAVINANYNGLPAGGANGGLKAKADKLYERAMENLGGAAKLIAMQPDVTNFGILCKRLEAAYGVNNAAAVRGAVHELLTKGPDPDLKHNLRAHFHAKDNIWNVLLGGAVDGDRLLQHAMIAPLDEQWQSKANDILARVNNLPIAQQNQTLRDELTHIQEAEEMENAREDAPTGAKAKAKKVQKKDEKQTGERGPNWQKNMDKKKAKKAKAAQLKAKAALVDAAQQQQVAGGPLMLPAGGGGGLMAPAQPQAVPQMFPAVPQVAAYGGGYPAPAPAPHQQQGGHKGNGKAASTWKWCNNHGWCNHTTQECKGKGKGKKGGNNNGKGGKGGWPQ